MNERSALARVRPRAPARHAVATIVLALTGLITSAAKAAEPLAVEPAMAADFKIAYEFDGGPNGGTPYTALVRGPDGALYGTTWNYGTAIAGTIFRIGPAGHLKAIATLGADGVSGATGPLVLAADGNFYGVTDGGNLGNAPCVFRVTPAGVVTKLHTFLPDGDANGTYPTPGLTLGPDGAMYGTTITGGANGSGVVYRITMDGTFSLVHSFNGADGATPRARLTLGPDGEFYGTTQNGGNGWGTIFRMDLQGNVTSLYSFGGPPKDGSQPIAPLTFGRDGRLYGTTSTGGANDQGTVFRLSHNDRKEQVLHHFAADGVDGTQPWGALLQASNGRFYGTTSGGGPLPSVCSGGAGCGTLYEISQDGRYQQLHQFNTGPGGQYPLEALYEAQDGRLYGSAYGDPNLPTNRFGAIFSIRQR